MKVLKQTIFFLCLIIYQVNFGQEHKLDKEFEKSYRSALDEAEKFKARLDSNSSRGLNAVFNRYVKADDALDAKVRSKSNIITQLFSLAVHYKDCKEFWDAEKDLKAISGIKGP